MSAGAVPRTVASGFVQQVWMKRSTVLVHHPKGICGSFHALVASRGERFADVCSWWWLDGCYYIYLYIFNSEHSWTFMNILIDSEYQLDILTIGEYWWMLNIRLLNIYSEHLQLVSYIIIEFNIENDSWTPRNIRYLHVWPEMNKLIYSTKAYQAYQCWLQYMVRWCKGVQHHTRIT